MDESCQFRTLAGFKLPLRSNPSQMHNETMMDGEVIIDTDNNKVCNYLSFITDILNYCYLFLHFFICSDI